MLISGKEHDLGGFSVRRVLPHGARRSVGPFVFFDHMGPADFKPGEGINVRPHPHINLATVTYLFDGEIVHRDSLGSYQHIEPGAINWMTAGRGIVHSERTSKERLASGGKMNGLQIWLALPLEAEEISPSFAHHPAASLQTFEKDGVTLKVLAGTKYGKSSPVEVHSPLFYVEAKMPSGAVLDVPHENQETAVYVVAGEVVCNGQRVRPFEMWICEEGKDVNITSAQSSHVMLLGGQNVGQRFMDWNFVSSTKERILEARKLWEKGPHDNSSRFLPIPDDKDEFIPLP